MKSKELMIGDLVYEGTNHQIKIKHNYGKSVRYDEGGYSHEVEEKLINPIPLTPKILEANGFVDDKAFECYYVVDKKKKDNVFFIEYFNRYIAVRISGTEVKLKYVHQLQQALRLRGLDDIADSIKI